MLKLQIISLWIVFYCLGSSSYVTAQHHNPAQLILYPSNVVVELHVNGLEKPDDLATIENRKVKKDVADFCVQRASHFKNARNGGVIYLVDSINHVLSKVAKNLQRVSGIKDSNYFKLYLYRDEMVNASSWGEGIIMINTGILSHFKTEAELAFVIGHEMGHDIQNHLMKRAIRGAELINDKNFKKELKDKQKHGGMLGLMTEVYSRRMGYSRQNEYEADSIGFLLMQAAGYNTEAAYDVLNMLKTADYFQYRDSIRFNEIFDNENFSFDTSWLKNDDVATAWARHDSLYYIPPEFRTHPDVDERIAHLSNMHVDHELIQQKRNSTSLFSGVFYLELETMIYSENYTKALFYALQLRPSVPHKEFVDCVVLHALYGIAICAKNNRFSSVVPFPDKLFPVSYNQLLSVFHSINSKLVIDMANAYYEKYILDGKAGNYEELVKILRDNLSSYDNTTQVKLNAALDAYKQSHPETTINLDNLKLLR